MGFAGERDSERKQGSFTQGCCTAPGWGSQNWLEGQSLRTKISATEGFWFPSNLPEELFGHKPLLKEVRQSQRLMFAELLLEAMPGKGVFVRYQSP